MSMLLLGRNSKLMHFFRSASVRYTRSCEPRKMCTGLPILMGRGQKLTALFLAMTIITKVAPKTQKFRSLFVVGLIVMSTNCLWAVDLYLDVSKAKHRRIVIAIPDFQGDGELSAEVAKIITDDLKFSGYFETIDNPLFLREAASKGEGNFGEWMNLGAELLVRGNITAGDEIILKCRLYDVKRGAQILGKVYKGERKLLRKIAHRFSDGVVRRVTGEEGISRTKVAFVSNSSGYKEIWIMDYDGHNLVRETRDRSLATVPSWLPDGKRIAYTTYREGNPDLYIRNIESGEVVKLCTFQGLNYGAAFSPGGGLFALTLTKDGNAEIYVFKSNGRGEKRLTHHPKIDCSPSWSPDGKFIVFTSGRAGGPHIYLMEAGGKVLKKLTDAGYNDSPDWSPRGDRVVYSSQGEGHFDIWIMNTDGSEKVQLTSNAGDNENPSFSPDGRHIVFSSTRDGNKNIYVMDVDGSNQKRLTFIEGDNEYPCWSPR